MTSQTVTPPALTQGRLGRKAVVWGMGQGLLALVWIVYALAGGDMVSWWLVAGLAVCAASGGLYILSGRNLKAGGVGGRKRLMLAAVLGLNWLAVFSFLAIFAAVMHPDVIVGDGVLTILIGFLLPLAHLIGNFWFLVAAINLGSGEWRPG